ncbi:hypothetical protein H072_6001 [Dactylellina haptotyla CBS 200.50]|uniref:NAD(P)-binding protein n=1 Tax=Dactylellina haptotyla (strain CBS 200.50) TaxID=1284197 RepID=S8BLG3_DACHA|nr:hypothetical protein H072_6001 [Dactylellina haptotyla CBS 200.50]
MGFTVASLPDLTGQIYFVTGGNAGIGLETIKALASKGATVYLGARSESKATAAIATIRESINNPDAPIHYIYLDHMDLSTIVAGAQSFLSKETALHGLLLNAGIMCTPWEVSKDGYEAHFQTNYLSHFLLTELLLPILKTTALNCEPGVVRFVEMASGAYMFAKSPGIFFDQIDMPKHEPIDRYSQSKLANVLHANEINKQLGPKEKVAEKGEIWVSSVDPGLVETGLSASYASTSLLGRTLIRLGMAATPAKGALTPIFATAGNGFKREWSGAHIVPGAKPRVLIRQGKDQALQDKLYKWTGEQLKSKGFLT